MRAFIGFTAKIIRAYRRSYERKWSFLGVSALTLFVCVSILGKLDLLPSTAAASGTDRSISVNRFAAISLSALTPMLPELPEKISIPSISLSAAILNPTSTDPVSLDEELLKGAVRYPTSARLNENGNVVLFAHSSYLPIVNNKAYKTFNGIQKLKEGDLIIVSSSDRAYTYRVKSIMKENTKDAAIPLSVEGRVLTLATCNSFASKEDRFIVTAGFVESNAIPFS